ncbi:lycopene cyclase domain-containing protein [Pedobacter sp. BS3]|uniref:lycopene cyclase domain-containing protein n=1 Tax=Pedobacter sp. BS3 TaxID=2567937 RepID=UPI0011ECAFAC|nr:lycopene cyclase domain-containing protein [Pedobacter sp. BS3]TZF81885.1 lycopene cyclase domain-containing protein [Pedobacter sp. BS3]
MNKQYTYLLINFLTVFFPVALSFDKRVQFYKRWKFIFPGLLCTGVLFLLWDYLFTIYDVWWFNPAYITEIYFFNLPVEELLFFITVPFACLFIYECLNHYVKTDMLAGWKTVISSTLALLCVFALIRYPDRVYTCITFGLLLVLIVYAAFIRRVAYLSRFYLAFAVSLIPFYIVNGLLTAIPVVIYNDQENMGIRIGSIPFEDHFYAMAMLLLNCMFFEYFKKKQVHE